MTREQHWTDSLFDSVYALYEAAHELELARAAVAALPPSVSYDRRQHHEGKVLLRDNASVRRGGPLTRRPHVRAMSALHAIYDKAVDEIGRQHEQATMLYASGALWAVREVQLGAAPTVVEFNTDSDGRAVHQVLGYEVPDLSPCTIAAPLAAAHKHLLDLLYAADYGEEIGRQDYVSDHEAGEMHDAFDKARGIPAAAMALGLKAQSALNYVLIGPRRERERQIAITRAMARAEAQAAESATN
jgi:hypothetical protein